MSSDLITQWNTALSAVGIVVTLGVFAAGWLAGRHQARRENVKVILEEELLRRLEREGEPTYSVGRDRRGRAHQVNVNVPLAAAVATATVLPATVTSTDPPARR